MPAVDLGKSQLRRSPTAAAASKVSRAERQQQEAALMKGAHLGPSAPEQHLSSPLGDLFSGHKNGGPGVIIADLDPQPRRMVLNPGCRALERFLCDAAGLQLNGIVGSGGDDQSLWVMRGACKPNGERHWQVQLC